MVQWREVDSLLPYTVYRADSRFAPSQWETALLCNDVSQWLGASLESALSLYSSLLLYTFTCWVVLSKYKNKLAFSIKQRELALVITLLCTKFFSSGDLIVNQTLVSGVVILYLLIVLYMVVFQPFWCTTLLLSCHEILYECHLFISFKHISYDDLSYDLIEYAKYLFRISWVAIQYLC